MLINTWWQFKENLDACLSKYGSCVLLGDINVKSTEHATEEWRVYEDM